MLTARSRTKGSASNPESLSRLATWMNIYAQRAGHFSVKQEEELRQLRRPFGAGIEAVARIIHGA